MGGCLGFLGGFFLVVGCLGFVWVVVGVACWDVGGVGVVVVACQSSVLM